MLNHLLRDELGRIRVNESIPGFTWAEFEHPHVSAEFRDVSGSRYLRPDIAAYFSGRTADLPYDPAIFAECKIINNGTSTIPNYLESGVVRFIDGSYSVNSPVGVMIAYVSSEHTLGKDLTKTFQELPWIRKIGIQGPLKRMAAVRNAFVSTHRREQTAICGNEINIHHIWLQM